MNSETLSNEQPKRRRVGAESWAIDLDGTVHRSPGVAGDKIVEDE